MLKFKSVPLPKSLQLAFQKFGIPYGIADVEDIVMAGALIDENGEIFLSDERYLQAFTEHLPLDNLTFSKCPNLKVANLSLGTDLFNPNVSETFSWAVFCNLLVTADGVSRINSESTQQSESTYRKNQWTQTFNQVGAKGFTIVGYGCAIDLSFERLKSLALENNEGITKLGEEFQFYDHRTLLRGQNYLFRQS